MLHFIGSELVKWNRAGEFPPMQSRIKIKMKFSKQAIAEYDSLPVVIEGYSKNPLEELSKNPSTNKLTKEITFYVNLYSATGTDVILELLAAGGATIGRAKSHDVGVVAKQFAEQFNCHQLFEELPFTKPSKGRKAKVQETPEESQAKLAAFMN